LKFAWVSVFELKLLISRFHENCYVVLEQFTHIHTYRWMDGIRQGCRCSWLQPYVTVV